MKPESSRTDGGGGTNRQTEGEERQTDRYRSTDRQADGRGKGQTDRYRGTDSREGLGTDRQIQRHRQSGGTRDRQTDTEAQTVGRD